MTATSPSSTPGVGSLPARRPSATMRPRSTVNQPPYIGSPSIGTSQAAWYRIIKWEDQIEWQSCRMAEWQNLKSVQSILQSCNSAILQFVLHVIPLFLARPTARGIEAQLLGDVRVASFPRAGQLEHAGHVALVADRITEDLVMHAAPFGPEAGVLDVADNLELVHAVAGAGRADDVFFDHHAAHVVRAIGEAELPHLSALRDPGGLEVVEVVENDARHGERPKVVDTRRFRDQTLGAKLGVVWLKTPRDERGEPAGFILQIPQTHHVFDALCISLDSPVHHGCRRAKAGAMCVAHDVEPFVRRGLAVAMELLPDAIDEDFGAAARDAVETGRDQPIDDRRHGQLRKSRQVDHFRRR